MLKKLRLLTFTIFTLTFDLIAIDARLGETCGTAEPLATEKLLLENIFKGKWALTETESEIVLAELRLAQTRPDYAKVLRKLYEAARELNPAAIDPRAWDEALDAPLADPTHQLLVENSHVRILKVIFEPGELGHYHTHKWAGIGVDLIPSDFIIYLEDGTQFQSLATDDPVYVHFEGQSPHAAENVGQTRYEGIHFEVKS